MKTFIVIPALNEEKRLPVVLDKLLDHGYEEIVVVDDGSIDQTFEVAKRYPIHALRHSINLGQGASLKTGIDYSLSRDAQIIITFDADGQHPVESISEFVKIIESGIDVALGSRFLHSQIHVPKTKQYLILKPAIYLNWFFTGLKLTDAHNGFRAFNRRAAELVQITQPEMAHATEIISEIARHNLSFREVPVEIAYSHYGQNFKSGLKVLSDLFKAKIIN